jgi:hypothetical protein
MSTTAGVMTRPGGGSRPPGPAARSSTRPGSCSRGTATPSPPCPPSPTAPVSRSRRSTSRSAPKPASCTGCGTPASAGTTSPSRWWNARGTRRLQQADDPHQLVRAGARQSRVTKDRGDLMRIIRQAAVTGPALAACGTGSRPSSAPPWAAACSTRQIGHSVSGAGVVSRNSGTCIVGDQDAHTPEGFSRCVTVAGHSRRGDPPFGAASAALAAISSGALNGLICATAAARFSGCPVGVRVRAGNPSPARAAQVRDAGPGGAAGWWGCW